MNSPNGRRTREITQEHRAALSVGRTRAQNVRNYLEALEKNRPKRGRRQTLESIRSRIEAIDNEIENARPLRRLHLAQERIDLEAKIKATQTPVDLEVLENAFVQVAKMYAQTHKISYAAWRAAGVPPAVLKRAGISR